MISLRKWNILPEKIFGDKKMMNVILQILQFFLSWHFVKRHERIFLFETSIMQNQYAITNQISFPFCIRIWKILKYYFFWWWPIQTYKTDSGKNEVTDWIDDMNFADDDDLAKKRIIRMMARNKIVVLLIWMILACY